MISLLSALAISPIFHQDPNDPTRIRGGSIVMNLGAGGDGLRNDSGLHTDVILADGTLFQANLTRGIADNRAAGFPLQEKWPGPAARISCVNATLTGTRGGTESADDFDLRSIAVNVRTLTGGNFRMYHNDSINFRLHGVGTWTSGQIEPLHPSISGEPVRYVEADLYIGDQPMKSKLSLGLKEGVATVWGDMSIVGQANQLGYVHVIFNFLTPVHLGRCTQAILKPQHISYKGFTLNGIVIYVKESFAGGLQRKVVLTQGMNINAKIAYNTTWTSDPFVISEYAIAIKKK